MDTSSSISLLVFVFFTSLRFSLLSSLMASFCCPFLRNICAFATILLMSFCCSTASSSCSLSLSTDGLGSACARCGFLNSSRIVSDTSSIICLSETHSRRRMLATVSAANFCLRWGGIDCAIFPFMKSRVSLLSMLTLGWSCSPSLSSSPICLLFSRSAKVLA